MEHIGIDLGGKESQICVRSETGDIVEEVRCPTRKIVGFFASRSPARVICETCTEAFPIAEQAQALGRDVRVVAATLVRALGVGHRGLKSDVRDARLLAEASARIELASVHIPSGFSGVMTVIHPAAG